MVQARRPSFTDFKWARWSLPFQVCCSGIGDFVGLSMSVSHEPVVADKRKGVVCTEYSVPVLVPDTILSV